MHTKSQEILQQNRAMQASYLDLGNLGLNGTESELADLQHFTWVESISFSSFWEEFDFVTFQNIEQKSKNEGRQNKLIRLPALPTPLKKLIVCDSNNTDTLLDITCLASSRELECLMLCTHKDADLTCIAHLEKLTYLLICENLIKDYSFLKNLTQLEYLYFSNSFYNSNTNFFKCVGKLDKLKYLSIALSDNTVNLESMKNLINIEYLYLSHSNINDIEYIVYFTKLRYLYLSMVKLKDIKPLGKLKNLEMLQIYDNIIDDFSPITSLYNLKKLQISGEEDLKLSNIDFLSNLPKLEDLDIDFDYIDDATSLKKLHNLKSLSIACKELHSIKVLHELKNIESISLCSFLKDISFMHNFKKIKRISLWGNHELENMSILSGLQNLEVLHLMDFNSKTALKKQDLVLYDLPNLKELFIDDEKVEYIYIKQNVRNLKKITIEGKMKNIVFEDAQENITEFYLYKNEGVEIDFMHILKSIPNAVKLRLDNASDQVLESIDIINNLKQLKELDLRYFTIKKDFFLHSLPNLETICMSDIKVDTIHIGNNMKNLKLFYYSHSTIKEIVFDNIQEKIKAVYVRNNNLTNLDFLASTPNVESLDFDGNGITSLEPLKKCVKYMYIDYRERVLSPPFWFIKAQARKIPFKDFADVESPPFFDKICQLLSNQEPENIELAYQLAVSQSWKEEDIADCKTYFSPK